MMIMKHIERGGCCSSGQPITLLFKNLLFIKQSASWPARICSQTNCFHITMRCAGYKTEAFAMHFACFMHDEIHTTDDPADGAAVELEYMEGGTKSKDCHYFTAGE
jgi:hypothetical protein